MKTIAAVLGFSLLAAAVSSPGSGGTTVAAKNLSGGFALLGKLIQKIVDPSVPAIANHASSSATSTTTPTTTTKGA